MRVDERLTDILAAAEGGAAPGRDDCAWLLGFGELTREAALTRLVADQVSRRRFGNEAMILAQIGVEIAPCPGGCRFCSFGEGHTAFTPSAMSDEEVLEAAHALAGGGELYALFLMTMHTFGLDRLLGLVARVRRQLPAHTQIVVNIGDFDARQAADLKSAGVDGAYHVCRLREGVDTALDPVARRATIGVIREAGLDWYNCCEPVGPEHTPAELAEQLYLGAEYGCFQHAAMRRVFVPGSPLAAHGQISDLRLAQVTAVVALSTVGCAETRSIAVHEPNLLGLTAGANTVYAEAGANPRDTERETSGHRGRDIAACQTMLYEAGFDRLMGVPDERAGLADVYRR